VRRRDGRRVAIKVNKLFRDPAYFAEVQRLQEALVAAGFPAPQPVRREGTVTVDAWLDVGSLRDAHEPAVRTAMATTLARFVALATATRLRPRREFLRPAGALWPKPHNVLFDFEATASGAEWIDELGRAALAGRDSAGAEVVGHTDWSAKHLRFDDALKPTALYDWDSVTVDREPVIVGTAAGSFTYTEELDHRSSCGPRSTRHSRSSTTTSERGALRSTRRSAEPSAPRACTSAATPPVAPMPWAATLACSRWTSSPPPCCDRFR